ncbi:MAG: RNA polymerase sigma factor [Acidobacteriota bacterium]
MKGRFLRRLLRLALGGEPEAFGELVLATRESLFWTVRRMTGRDAIAEEILQEAYLALWERGTGGLPEEPEAWLRRFCVNRAIDFLRREETRRTEGLPEGLEVEGPAGPGDGGLYSREVEEALEEGLATLPPQERAAFLLRVVEELPYGEVARALGVAESTARNQVMQARRKMERFLTARGIEP